MKNILDIARVVRSKNSGPYELVLDIMLKDRKLFDALRASGQFSPQRIAEAYGVGIKEIRRILGLNKERKVILVGVGHLGRALLSYKGFADEGFTLCGLFDSDPAKIERPRRGPLPHGLPRSASSVNPSPPEPKSSAQVLFAS